METPGICPYVHTAIRPQVTIHSSQLSDSVRYLASGPDETRPLKNPDKHIADAMQLNGSVPSRWPKRSLCKPGFSIHINSPHLPFAYYIGIERFKGSRPEDGLRC